MFLLFGSYEVQRNMECLEFYVRGSERDKILSITVQRHATISSKLIYYKVTLHVSGVAPINRSAQKCNYSLRYRSYRRCSYLIPAWPIWPRWNEIAARYDLYRMLYLQFYVLLMMGATTPETCRVTL